MILDIYTGLGEETGVMALGLLLQAIITGWNAKIVVLKKTTLQLYFKTCIEKNQFSYIDYVVELTYTGWKR